MKTRFLVLGAAVLALAWAGQARADGCDFTRQTADLKSFKSDDASSTDKELALRQGLLYGVIDCLTSSTQTLKSAYDALPYAQNGLNLKTRLENDLNGNIFYYGEKKKEVDGSDIAQTKFLAKEILDWKKGQEDTLARASYFLIWAKNQSLLSLAEDRLAQISALKLSSPNKNSLTQAKTSLAAADSFNSSAQASLEQNAAPADSLSLIKQSLEKMLDSYKYFIKIGESQ